jgi:hypothetical protein
MGKIFWDCISEEDILYHSSPMSRIGKVMKAPQSDKVRRILADADKAAQLVEAARKGKSVVLRVNGDTFYLRRAGSLTAEVRPPAKGEK